MATKFTSAGADNLQWSYIAPSGYITGAANLDATDTGTSSSAARFKGLNNAAVALPDTTKVATQGDDTILANFMFGASAPFTFNITTQALDTAFLAAACGVTIVTEAERTMFAGATYYPSANQLWLMLTRQSKSLVTGSTGAKLYEHLEIPRAEVSFLGSALNFQGAAEYNWSVTVNPTDVLPDGRSVSTVFTDAPDGMVSYILHSSDYRMTRTAFVGDGTITAIPISYKAASAGKTHATVETTGFAAGTVSSVSTSSPYTATLSAAPGSGKFSIVTHQFLNF